MKLKALAAAALAVCCVTAMASTSHEKMSDKAASASNSTVNAMSDLDKISYTLGADMGANFRNNGIKVDSKILLEGLDAGLEGKPLKMSKKQMEETLIHFQKQLQAKRKAEFKSISAKNRKTGVEFLAENKTKKGVISLPDGLQYKVISAGSGAKPKANDIVTVNYEGRFVNGKVFDSSYKRGRPATFPVGQVIKGWQQALQMMKAGATWEVFIPAKLAYGEDGIGGVIGPNETLVFKINLMSIKAPKK